RNTRNTRKKEDKEERKDKSESGFRGLLILEGRAVQGQSGRLLSFCLFFFPCFPWFAGFTRPRRDTPPPATGRPSRCHSSDRTQRPRRRDRARSRCGSGGPGAPGATP